MRKRNLQSMCGRFPVTLAQKSRIYNRGMADRLHLWLSAGGGFIMLTRVVAGGEILAGGRAAIRAQTVKQNIFGEGDP